MKPEVVVLPVRYDGRQFPLLESGEIEQCPNSHEKLGIALKTSSQMVCPIVASIEPVKIHWTSLKRLPYANYLREKNSS